MTNYLVWLIPCGGIRVCNRKNKADEQQPWSWRCFQDQRAARNYAEPFPVQYSVKPKQTCQLEQSVNAGFLLDVRFVHARMWCLWLPHNTVSTPNINVAIELEEGTKTVAVAINAEQARNVICKPLLN